MSKVNSRQEDLIRIAQPNQTDTQDPARDNLYNENPSQISLLIQEFEQEDKQEAIFQPHVHAQKNLLLAFLLNFLFAIIEIIGGFLTNSMAILSDALHDFGDSLSIGLSWYFERLSQKTRDHRFSYGYKRLSLLSALITSSILFTGSVFIIYETIPRLIQPQEVKSSGMIALAILGILINGGAVLRMRKGHSANERVIRLHLLEDVLGWIAVLAGAVLMHFFKLPILDPLLSVAIAGFILWNVFRNIREFVKIFLQGIPSQLNLDRIMTELLKIADVKSVHDVHIWSMDGDYIVLSAHIVVSDTISANQIIEIKKAVRQLIKKFGIQHETVEIEYERECCEFVKC